MKEIHPTGLKIRTHAFEIFLGFLMLGFVDWFLFYSAFRNFFRENNVTAGLIFIGAGVIFSWLYLIVQGTGVIILTISREKISIRRPLLAVSPFNKSQLIFNTAEIREINITRPHKVPVWRFISVKGEEMFRLKFQPGYISSNTELKDYFEKNGINIRVT
jgi:hypothetical protein